MRRTIRILVLAGTPLLAIGLVLLDFSAASFPIFDCWGPCPESTLATALAGRPIQDVPLAILSVVPVVVAWILCLVQLVRIGRWGVAAALALALPVLAALSLSRFYATNDGTWLPNAAATSTFAHSLALLLFWPVATFLATFAVRKD
jgi:hypothetical protein